MRPTAVSSSRCPGLLLVWLIWLSACSVNPYTQRSQLVLTSPTFEGAIGLVAYQRMLSDPAVSLHHDPLTSIAIHRVAARVMAAAGRSKYADMAHSFEWDISVIDDDDTRNAVALPGGKIVIYTGLFPIAKDEAGLAAVLSHEIVHALARHSAEQLTYDALKTTRQQRSILPFSRKHELEADYIGLLLMAEAGYDPNESVHMWERMKQSGEEMPPEQLSTHPSYETRIAELYRHLPEARAVYARSRSTRVSQPHTATQTMAVSTGGNKNIK